MCVKEIDSTEKDALDWVLLTNLEASSFDTAGKVIDGYRKRWRIEEFHRTWKQGDCNVEDAQLHSLEALRKWGNDSRRRGDANRALEVSRAHDS